MDFQKNFEISPLPLEKEFQVEYLKQNLHILTREQLEDLLSQCLSVITRLTHQTKQLMALIEEAQGKSE
jgi:hypothetical protein